MNPRLKLQKKKKVYDCQQRFGLPGELRYKAHLVLRVIRFDFLQETVGKQAAAIGTHGIADSPGSARDPPVLPYGEGQSGREAARGGGHARARNLQRRAEGLERFWVKVLKLVFELHIRSRIRTSKRSNGGFASSQIHAVLKGDKRRAHREYDAFVLNPKQESLYAGKRADRSENPSPWLKMATDFRARATNSNCDPVSERQK